MQQLSKYNVPVSFQAPPTCTGDCKSYSLSLSLASLASFVKEAIFFFKIQFSGALLSFCFEISEKHLNVNDAKKVLKT